MGRTPRAPRLRFAGLLIAAALSLGGCGAVGSSRRAPGDGRSSPVATQVLTDGSTAVVVLGGQPRDAVCTQVATAPEPSSKHPGLVGVTREGEVVVNWDQGAVPGTDLVSIENGQVAGTRSVPFGSALAREQTTSPAGTTAQEAVDRQSFTLVGSDGRTLGAPVAGTFTAFSPDGSLAVSTTSRGHLAVLATATGAVVARIDGTFAFFSPDSRFLVLLDAAGRSSIWSMSDNRVVHTLAADEGAVTPRAFSADSSRLLVTDSTADFQGAVLYRTDDWSVVGRLVTAGAPLTAVLARNGSRAVLTDKTQELIVWNPDGSSAVATSGLTGISAEEEAPFLSFQIVADRYVVALQNQPDTSTLDVCDLR